MVPATSQSSALSYATSTAFFPTALAEISNTDRVQHARLLMDSGASLSLITERLADALHAERHRHHVKVTGLAGGLVSKALCEFIFLFCSQPPG